MLSQEEVARFLGAVDNLKQRVILTVFYAMGLRTSEAVRLEPSSKVHMAVVTLGHLLALHVTPADVGDREEVGRLAEAIRTSPAIP